MIISVWATRADTPLPPPAKVRVMSPNGRIRAVSDPGGWHACGGREATQDALVGTWFAPQFIRC
jgi:hypothetical protein